MVSNPIEKTFLCSRATFFLITVMGQNDVLIHFLLKYNSNRIPNTKKLLCLKVEKNRRGKISRRIVRPVLTHLGVPERFEN